MPLPNARVIGPRWSAHHRPVVDATLTGECTIRHPAAKPTPGDLDPETGTYPDTGQATPHFTGACRVQVLLTDSRVETAGDQVTVAGYLVVVSQTATEVRVGDIVAITAVDDNGSPALAGRELRVTGVARGTLTWEQDLTCSAA